MLAYGFTTCLWFDGQAEEAASFYTSVFPNASIGQVGRYSEAGPGEPGSVMTVEFVANGQKFLALNGGPEFTFNHSISFQLFCDDQAEIDHYWEKLTDGGQEVQCGWLTDRFGVSWQVIPKGLIEMLCDPDPARAKRTSEAMFTMKKLDLAALRRAYEGQPVAAS